MDEIKPLQRKRPIVGLLADALGAVDEFARKPFGYDNPPAQILSGLLGLPEIQRTLDDVSYGQPLTKGKGLNTKLKDHVAQAVLSMPSPRAIGGLLGGIGDVDKAAIVWHGSPHKFSKFDSGKIGTGEGAQAYGHGLYLAESPEVAGQYQRALADKVQRGRAIADATGKEIPIGNTIDADALAALDMVSAGKALPKNHASLFSKAIAAQDKIARFATDTNAVARAGQVKQRLLDLKNSGARLFDEQSNLYKVDLPDTAIARMLDWDKPLSQQAFGIPRSVVNEVSSHRWNLRTMPSDPTGQQFVQALQRMQLSGGEQAALMRRANVPGIRYLDGGSRNLGVGSSNFVVFPGEEGLLTILERNGKPLP